MLQIEHVTKKYKNFTALEDINLELGHGVYGLLAPNGAGKTTLMKMITTLLFPTEGRICYDGTEIQKMDAAYREKIGFLPQDFGYYRDYTPERYLRYIGILKGMKGETLKDAAAWALDLVGLTQDAGKKMKKFSGGMIQRVGIAQALLNDPEILVLDEPTAGLDPKERLRFRKILTSLSRDRMVLISTHIVSDVEFIANHIIMIKDKKIFCNDTVENICATLRGRVFETAVEAAALSEWEKNYQIVSQRQEGPEVVIRFICQKEQLAAAQKQQQAEAAKQQQAEAAKQQQTEAGKRQQAEAAKQQQTEAAEQQQTEAAKRQQAEAAKRWRPCQPGLEDVFLYTYNSAGEQEQI